MSRYAMTVTGPIPADEIGFTLSHEHVFFDTTAWHIEPTDERKRRIGELPVSRRNLEDLRRDPLISRDNLTFFDPEIAIEELTLFKEAGGNTIIDVTPPEMKRNPEALFEVAQATGVNIVAGIGHYMQAVHPPEVAEQSVHEIASRFVDEITKGFGGSGIRPGVIGEIGTSGSIHPDERKVLGAAAIAHRETGLTLSIHPPVPYEKRALEILDLIEQEGAALDRVIMGHCYHSVSDLDYHRRIAERGAVLAYDRFGAEFYWESWPGGPFEDPDASGGYREPRDSEVVDAIVQLVKEGYGSQIVISHDTCYKIQLNHYGGHGFAHIANHVVRYFRDRGLTESQVEQITVRTPMRLFSVEDR